MTRLEQYIKTYTTKHNFTISEKQEGLIEKAKARFLKRKKGIDTFKMLFIQNINSFKLDLSDVFEYKAEGRK
jgi:hypothetical protein